MYFLHYLLVKISRARMILVLANSKWCQSFDVRSIGASASCLVWVPLSSITLNMASVKNFH